MATKRPELSHKDPDSPGAAAPADEPESIIEEVAGEVVDAIEEAGELSARIARGTVVGLLTYLGEVGVLLGQTLRALRRGIHVGDLVRQMAFIGVDSLPIALLTTAFSGAVVALYSVRTFLEFGAGGFVGGLVGLSIVRETAPILSGIMLAARSGSAMTAEIGSMKVTEQIDALRSMAVSPVEYLVAPRLLACLIMLPAVCVLADLVGILGGGFVAVGFGVSWTSFTLSLRQFLDPGGMDIYKGLIKTVFFGAIIAIVGCREGLESEGGATGVGQSTTRSVVVSIVLIFMANFLLTFLMFG